MIRTAKQDRLRGEILSALESHLGELGFNLEADGTLTTGPQDKDLCRQVHSEQRIQKLRDSRKFIEDNLYLVDRHIANGNQVHPTSIMPERAILPDRDNGPRVATP